ncbi:MAG: deoxyribodipyrimidine photo-lyase [Gammaproteobacteria bacterium]|nr:deoxyribodipyrimidine photo-lyase [Gammaproteobacteria bacterium]
MSNDIAIAWFRQDLRLVDNPALRAAAEHARVLPIYILDDAGAGDWARGAASRAWLHRSLSSLDRSLDAGLRCFAGDAGDVLAKLTRDLPVTAVYWNRCYEPWRRERDTRIKQTLIDAGLDCRSFNASLLWEPWEIEKESGGPYRVFTPFWKKGCLRAAPPPAPLPAPERLELYRDALSAAGTVDDLDLLSSVDWHTPMLAHWQPGEAGAAARLEEFCVAMVGDYQQLRDFPAQPGTSRLSPHLHFGELSPRQAWQRADQARFEANDDGVDGFLRELGWREFSYHLLYHFPQLPEANFNNRFDAFAWESDAEGLRAWQRGQTGYPIVDAGMRELWQTGYMHNRVRMIVASFLVKNLLLHWREGERWFWDCLVDADLASNSASWQWCAGSGADAAPYFRIFNPLLQSEKFDRDGEYIARYCPELAGLPPRWRHKPWQADAATLAAANLRLGEDYPRPILDLKMTRERALARFKALG